MSSQKKEKLLIENLLASRELFSRCVGIIKSEYFDQPEYVPAVDFILDFFQNYNNVPPAHVVNAEFDLDFGAQQVTTDMYQYNCDSIESFCKEAAVLNAVRKSYELIKDGQTSAIVKLVQDAVQVALHRDMGIRLHDDPEGNLNRMKETAINFPTLIKGLDDNLDGGFARQTLTLISANSGVGKSNMLLNLAINYSLQGMHVAYISLELPQDMLYIRACTIETGAEIAKWRENIHKIAGRLLQDKENGAGSFTIKRLKGGTSSNDIQSYLREYELQYGYKPDVIAVDYLDLMYPNGGIKNKGVYEQDKEKAEELTELLVSYDAIGLTASQQNRESLRMAAPDQGVIAGGISKVNTVHNYISLYMNDEMALRGDLMAFFLKTRSSQGKGNSTALHFNRNTLQITDSGKDPAKGLPKLIKTAKWGKGKAPPSAAPLNRKLESIVGELGLPKTETTFQDVDTLETVNEETGDLEIHHVDVVYEDETPKASEDGLTDLFKEFGD
jgi:RecA/RadA recombinase